MAKSIRSIHEILQGITGSDEQIQKGTDAGDIKKEYSAVQLQIEQEKLRKMRLENEQLEGENEGDNQDREQRKDFAVIIYELVLLHFAFVFMILFLNGFSFCGFELSDSIMNTLLGTTTANVISLLVIVVTYFFSKKKK